MGSASLLSRLPALRLLIPLACGIVLFRYCQCPWMPALLVAGALLVLVMLRLSRHTVASMMRRRASHIVALSLAVIAVGWCAAWVAEPVTIDINRVNGSKACARVETIKYNEQSMLMQVKLLNAKVGETVVPGIHVLLSTRGCDYDLLSGDLIVFNLNLSQVNNMGNPDEMDYARYLHDKGILYRQHCDVRELARVGTSGTVMTRIFNLRQELEHRVLNSTLSPQSQGLIIAMLLGNDDFIEPAVRDSFSRAGVAHVLALSGLHVAVISFLIWFLLFPLDYARGKKLRLVLTLLIIIAYCVFTGLSPSVIRSTVMIGFVFMSTILYRKSTPLNSMLVAALLILVFSPSSLFNIGFQLSFLTVGALIVSYQAFEIKFPENKLLNYFCSTVLTSLIAMVSTLVLTAYYFNTVSLMSVVTNVLIMPLIPLFMLLGAIALVMLWMGAQAGLLNDVIDLITGAIEHVAQLMASTTLAHSGYYVSWVAVVVYYGVLALLALWIMKRNARFLLAAGLVLVAGMAYGLVQDARLPRRGLVIFNSFNSTPLLYFNENKALLWVPDVENDFDIANFKRWNRSFLAHYHIDSITLVDSTRCELPGGIIDPPFANLQGVSLVAAGKGRWKHYCRDDSVKIKFDYALITKGFHSDVATLKSLIDCDSIMLSGGIYHDDMVTLEQECSTNKIPHYNIPLNGAYIVLK